MPTPPDPTERRYSDQELSLILKRATERQALSPRGGGDGLSLREIQEIAAEVGLSPEEVAMAAAQVGAEAAGHATGSAFELTIPAELDARQVEELFEAARDRTRADGTVSREPDGASWSSTSGLRSTRVAVTSRRGRSRLTVSERGTVSTLGAAVGGVLVAIVLIPVSGLLFASLVGTGFLALVLGVTAGIVAGLATGWALLRRLSSRARERTNALGSDLARVAMRLVTRGDAPGGTLEASRDTPRLPGEAGS